MPRLIPDDTIDQYEAQAKVLSRLEWDGRAKRWKISNQQIRACGTTPEELGLIEKPLDPLKPRLCTEKDALRIFRCHPRRKNKPAAIRAIKCAARILALRGNQDPVGFLEERTIAYASSAAGQQPENGRDLRPYPTRWYNEELFLADPTEWERPLTRESAESQADKDHRAALYKAGEL